MISEAFEIQGKKISKEAKKVFKMLDRAIYSGKDSIPISNLTRAFGQDKTYELTEKMCTKFDWLSTEIIPSKNWGSLIIDVDKFCEYFYMSREEIDQEMITNLVEKYSLNGENVNKGTLTKTNSGNRDVGLVRDGFQKQSQFKFKYDIELLEKYFDWIVMEELDNFLDALKKYNNISERVNYATVVREVIIGYITDMKLSPSAAYYCMGGFITDTRGRVIYDYVSKIFNPITSKIARALMVVEPQMIYIDDYEIIEDIYLFIAEECGGADFSIGVTIEEKAEIGMNHYKNRTMPDGECISYINLWMSRIYNELDELYKNGQVNSVVPIEVDVTASGPSVNSIAFDFRPGMSATNAIVNHDDKMFDAWFVNVEKSKRKMFRHANKKIATPWIYSSNASAVKLLKKAKVDLPLEDIAYLENLIKSPESPLLASFLFKDLVVKHSYVNTPTYKVKCWNDDYVVEIGRKYFMFTEESEVTYHIAYDSVTGEPSTFTQHHPITVIDYKFYNLFLATGFTHNLDSQVSNIIGLLGNNLGNHDGFIIHAKDARSAKRECMKANKELNEVGRRNKDGELKPITTYIKSINVSKYEEITHLDISNVMAKENIDYKTAVIMLKAIRKSSKKLNKEYIAFKEMLDNSSIDRIKNPREFTWKCLK